MKTFFQNTLILLIILFLVSCKAVELRPDTAPASPSPSSSSSTPVSSSPPRIIAFEANPPYVPEGSSFTLNWKTDNASEVHISGIGRVSPTGQQTITPDKDNIILTASNNSGFPPATKQLPMHTVMFSTIAPPGVPLNQPVYIIADKNKFYQYKKTYRFKAISRVSDFSKVRPATPQNTPPRTTGVTATSVIRDHRNSSAPSVIRDHRNSSAPSVIRDHRSLPAPQLLSPRNQSRLNYYPRNLTLRWKPVANAKSYIVEIDCLNCCARGKWCRETGKTYKRIPALTHTQYRFQFVGAQAGRWRVQAVDRNGKAGKPSQWYNFVFTR